MSETNAVRRDTTSPGRTAFLFDLDGTLVDSVWQHVLAGREAPTEFITIPPLCCATLMRSA